jgi:hypothetical protein
VAKLRQDTLVDEAVVADARKRSRRKISARCIAGSERGRELLDTQLAVVRSAGKLSVGPADCNTIRWNEECSNRVVQRRTVARCTPPQAACTVRALAATPSRVAVLFRNDRLACRLGRLGGPYNSTEMLR